MRAPDDEAEQVGAAAAGDPAAVAALWDAYGPRLFAFCHRLLGDPHAAADAAQDAFLLVHPQLGSLQRAGASVGDALFRAARTTSYELLSRAPRDAPRGGVSLSAAAARLRPQQRAALALAGLEGLSHREIATVLDTSVESVPAILARARLRLLDELRGTALAAAAARTPACEEALPLLAAAADGELAGADAAWAESHAAACATCPRSRRAMQEAAATYAAWSPAAAPSWLRGATLAELGADVPAAGAAPLGSAAAASAGKPVAAAWFTPRPSLSAALMGSTLLIVAFGTLVAATIGPLRQAAPAPGAIALPAGSPTVTVAAAPQPVAPKSTQRAPTRRGARRAPSSTVSRVVLVRSVGTAPVVSRPTAPRAPPARPAPRRHRRPTGRPSRKPTATAPAPVATAPAPTGPADATPGTGSPAAPTTATAASTSTPPAAGSPGSPTQPPPSSTPPVPIKHESGDDDGDDDDQGDDDGHRQRGKGPGPPPCDGRDGGRGDDGWHDGGGDGSGYGHD